MSAQRDQANHTDVAIVGCGPTGATLANLLGQCGLSVVILERESAVYPLPRAVHFDDEIMRVFQTVGIANQLAEKVIINKGMRFCDYQGNVLLDWPRPQSLTPNAWHASYRFHQPQLEALLRAALSRYSAVQLKSGYALDSAFDRGTHCELTLRQIQNGSVSKLSASYVVGCDGARSTLRRCMQVGMRELGFAQRWLVVDLRLKRTMPSLGEHTIQYCDASRPATYCRNPGNRRRWEFALHVNESAKAMSSDANVWRLLRRWVSDKDAIVERKAVYTFKSEVAEQWQTGRMLLAGDAAHLTPPFMGQGMCAGIRDVANLAWKLVRCCRGTAAQELLESYQSERSPNVTEYIATAVKLGQLINRMGSETADNGPYKMQSLDSKLGAGLGCLDDTLRGQLFPQLRLRDERLLDDVVGYKFCLLGYADVIAVQHDNLLHLHCEREPRILEWLQRFGVKAVLVRPDRYIYATVTDQHQCERMLAGMPISNQVIGIGAV